MLLHKTPLRYPGGKQRLTPFMEEIIAENRLEGAEYVEPYAGGAGVAINLMLSGCVSHIHLNDSYRPLIAFWRSILNDTERFCKMVTGVSLTIKEWHRQKAIFASPETSDDLELGFSLFYLNRCNRSGILTAGVIGGKEQNGPYKLDARFSINALLNRIELIARYRHRVSVYNMDAEQFIQSTVSQMSPRTLMYLDPPYYHKGQTLYPNHYIPRDHQRIAELTQSRVSVPWVVSYDNAPEIQALYQSRVSFTYDLQYSAVRTYRGSEVFIFSDDLRIPARSSMPNIDRSLRIQGDQRHCSEAT